MFTTVNATDVTDNIIFERLYLVSGLGTFGPESTVPMHPQPRPFVHTPTISQFPCNFFPRMAPQFFGHHDSPSNLAESRYPGSLRQVLKCSKNDLSVYSTKILRGRLVFVHGSLYLDPISLLAQEWKDVKGGPEPLENLNSRDLRFET